MGRGISFALALTTALGCSALAPPLTPPERGGAAWTELTGAHFILDTDLDRAEAREALGEFEGIFIAFRDVAFSPDIEPRTRIRIVLFRRKQDYHRFAPEHTSGYFSARLPNDIDVVPTMVLWGGLVDRTRLVFQHELAHLFVRRSFSAVPRWLNEGLAEYYSTFELKDGAAILGKPLPDAGISTLSLDWRLERVGSWQRLIIPIGKVPSVAQIVGADAEEFRLSSENGPPTQDDKRRLEAFYYGAWGLVHMLYSVPEHRARFNSVVSAVTQGKSVKEAWEEQFSDVAKDKLEADFREHIIRTEKIEALTRTTQYSPPPPAPPEMERPLSPADVHLLWARLHSWHFDAPRALARPDIEAARALDPGSPEVQFWSALFHIHEGRHNDAEADITRALEQRPNDARYIMTMVNIAERVPGSAAASRIDELMERLGKVAVSSKALDSVANYRTLLHKTDEAMAFSLRSIKADPTCFRCYSTLARLHREQGQIDEAVAAAERAINLLPDGVTIPDLTDAFNFYVHERERMRREKAPAKEGAPAP